MAEAKEKAVKAAIEEIVEAPVIVYSVQEYASSGLFSCPPECVFAAFRHNGISEATLSEAKRIVKAFLTKEVK